MTVKLPTAITGAPDDGPGEEPVFVDSSGGRRRLLRKLGWVLGVASLAYAVVLGISLAGGDAGAPDVLIPGPDKKASDKVEVDPTPSKTVSEPPGTGNRPSPSVTAEPPPTAPEQVPTTKAPSKPTGKPTVKPVPTTPKPTGGPGGGNGGGPTKDPDPGPSKPGTDEPDPPTNTEEPEDPPTEDPDKPGTTGGAGGATG